MKRWIPLFLFLLLCGCGQSDIETAVDQSTVQEGSGTALVQEGSAIESDAETEEDRYDERYYTSEKASIAETIRADSAPSAAEEVDADEELTAAVKEYASCLYPEYNAADAAASTRMVNGKAYLFFDVKDDSAVIFCTIAYDEQEDIFFLYDSEVEQLIPIEYDSYGIRLVS